MTVFGSRCTVRPVMGQAEDGTWTFDPASVTFDDNAIDELVQLALESL